MADPRDDETRRLPPYVPNRRTEPFIYVPPPPRGWITIRVRTLHDIVVILLGTLCLVSQLYKDVVQHREVTYWIVAAGLVCLGYEGAVWRDRSKHAEQVITNANRS